MFDSKRDKTENDLFNIRSLHQTAAPTKAANNKNKSDEEPDIKTEIRKKISQITMISQNNSYKKLFSKRKNSNKVLWFTCFVVSVSLFSFVIFKSVKNYLKYDVITKIRTNHETPAQFPTISICNLDPFVTQNASRFIFNLYKSKLGLNLTKENWQSKEMLHIVRQTKQFILSNALNPNLDNTDRKSFGFFIEDILHECKFNLNECSAQDFSWYYSYDYGSCFKFNSGFNSENKRTPIKYSSKPGEYYGLNLKFVLGQSRNSFSLADSNGLKVFIHNNSFEPLSTDAIEVELSKLTNIRIKKSFTHKSPAPYSDCFDTKKSNSILYKQITESNKVYRQSDCIDLCSQRYIIENCGCYYLRYPKLFNHSACLNFEEINCAQNSFAKFLEKNIMQVCSADCPLGNK